MAKQELIFATANKNKAKEISALLPHYTLLTLPDIGITIDIPETGSTLKENAAIKSMYVFKSTGKACFADDTGLVIDALNGEPGVYSARYAGEEKSDKANLELVLQKLKHETNRIARFITYISYTHQDNTQFYIGVLEGTIAEEPRGNQGFGYDPIFIPKGFDKTLAEMLPETKNSISHRAIAFNKFIQSMQA
jgi:XTP/dITP diphosphohydrolase